MSRNSAQARPLPPASSSPEVHKLDWLKAAIIGLTSSEVIILRYIADIDGHTAEYMREVLETQVPAESESKTFLTLWNEEEFSNCRDMVNLLSSCGVNLVEERRRDTPRTRSLLGWIGSTLRTRLGRLMPQTASALHLSWAASQKYMLVLAYEQLAATTTNPVLRVLCLRIARQERRNFAWYFNGARAVLRRAEGSQGVVRFLFEKLWYPLSAATQSRQRAHQLIQNLFPTASIPCVMLRLDEVMSQLPGFESATFAQRFAMGSHRPAPRLQAVNA